MTALEDLMVAAKIEAAENDIRHAHNSIENDVKGYGGDSGAISLDKIIKMAELA